MPCRGTKKQNERVAFWGLERAQGLSLPFGPQDLGRRSYELTCGRGEGCRDPAWRALGRPSGEGDGILLGWALPGTGRRPVNVCCGVRPQHPRDLDTWRTFSGWWDMHPHPEMLWDPKERP